MKLIYQFKGPNLNMHTCDHIEIDKLLIESKHSFLDMNETEKS